MRENQKAENFTELLWITKYYKNKGLSNGGNKKGQQTQLSSRLTKELSQNEVSLLQRNWKTWKYKLDKAQGSWLGLWQKLEVLGTTKYSGNKTWLWA